MTEKTSAPYETLANIYDHVMQHVNYRSWAMYIKSIHSRYDTKPASVVDLACGTGNLTFELERLGYDVVGIDKSPAMIATAREKGIANESGSSFHVADLCKLTDIDGLEEFDTAVCAYDSFNYLLTTADALRACEQVFRILVPNGLFIFDVCTERNSLRYFDDVRDSGEGPGFSYKRHSYYDRKRNLQYNHFSIELDSGPGVHEETHTQHIYSWSDLQLILEACPFELLGAFSGFTFNKGSARSDRVHFVLRRP